MRVLITTLATLLLTVACARERSAAPPAAADTGVIEVSAAPPPVVTSWTPLAACDSVAEIARRVDARAVISRGTDSLQFGERPAVAACLVTVALPAPENGDAPISFEDGIGDRDWAQVIELLSDGEDSHGYGLRRPGVLCQGFEGTRGTTTFTTSVTCGPEPVVAAPLKEPELPDPSLDKPLSVAQNGQDACYHYTAYTIAADDRDTLGGSDFYVRQGPDASCAFDSLPGDLVIRNEWAEYYLGLSGTTLLLDSGTGMKRGMLFYDLRTGKKYFTGGYNDLAGGGPPGTIGTWGDTSLDPATSGCRPGSQVIVERLTWVTIATGETRPSEYLRCGFTE